MAQIALTLAPSNTLALRLKGPAGATFELAKPTAPMVAAALEIMRGPRGLPGLSGNAGAISTDPSNRLTVGDDEGLLVPDLATDPVAYYILAKA